MNKFRVLCTLGDGTYGTVEKAVNVKTNQVVAIKKMKRKFYSWKECLDLTEVRALRSLAHPNIIKLHEVIRSDNMLHLVFEFIERNLYQVTKKRTQHFPEKEVKSIIYQTLKGVHFIH